MKENIFYACCFAVAMFVTGLIGVILSDIKCLICVIPFAALFLYHAKKAATQLEDEG